MGEKVSSHHFTNKKGKEENEKYGRMQDGLRGVIQHLIVNRGSGIIKPEWGKERTKKGGPREEPTRDFSSSNPLH